MEQGPLIWTGTLIAVRLTRSDGFSAREAMGWLRIMRPGSVIGEQQRFLCALESIVPNPTLEGGSKSVVASDSMRTASLPLDVDRGTRSGVLPRTQSSQAVLDLTAWAAAADAAAAGSEAGSTAPERARDLSAALDRSRSAGPGRTVRQ